MANNNLTTAGRIVLMRGSTVISKHDCEVLAIKAAQAYAYRHAGNYKLSLKYLGEQVRVVGVLPPGGDPAKPQNFRVTEFSDDFVSLAWDSAADASLWGVYRATGVGAFSEIDEVNVPTFTDSTVAAATTYRYKVQARSSGGSTDSDEVEVTTTAQAGPAIPTGLAVIDDITASQVPLGWDDAADAGEWDVLRDAIVIATVTQPLYTDTTVQPDTGYTYQLVARNSTGDSAPSSGLAVTTPVNTPPQWTIVDQVGSLGSAFSLDLNSVCSDTDGQGALEYGVVGGTLPTGLALNGSTISGTFTAVGNFTATLEADDGFDAATIEVDWVVSDPDVTAPTVPANVVGSANGSTVTVTWDLSTDASGILHYQVQRNGVFRSNVNAPPYVETGVPDGSYTYQIRARDASTNQNVSAAGSSNLVTVTTAPAAPDSPINFTVTANSDTQLTLAWQPGPNGAAPTDYELDFSTVGVSGPWTSIPVGLVTTIAHTGLTADTQYFYRLRALNGQVTGPYAMVTGVTQSGQPELWPPYDFPGGSTSAGGTLTVVPLFNQASLYWDETTGSPTNEALVRFRETSTAPSGPWRQGISMWWDDRTFHASNPPTVAGSIPYGFKQYRSMLIGLKSNTAYQVEVLTATSRRIKTGSFTTLNDSFTIDPTKITTPALTSTSVLNIGSGQSGSALNGYRVYDRVGGWTIDGNNSINDGIVFDDVSYVILRNFRVTDVKNFNVRLIGDCHHIVLEEFLLDDMGHPDTDPGAVNPQVPGEGFACNNSAGIMIGNTGGTNFGIMDILIQRGEIRNPKYDSNCWDEERPTNTNANGANCGPTGGDGFHPAGTTAIYAKDPFGRIVIRYVKVHSTNNKLFDDGLGGAQNFSANGNLGRDSAIYGCEISQVADDACEIEGGCMCVYAGQNLIHHARTINSSGACAVGPKYIHQVVGHSGWLNPAIGTGSEGWFLKLRSKPGDNVTPPPPVIGAGPIYLINCTAFKTSSANSVQQAVQLDRAAASNLHAWNCILDMGSSIGSTNRGFIDSYSDFDDNVYQVGATKPSSDTNGQVATAGQIAYEPTHASGQFTPAATATAVIARAHFVPNFADEYLGANPDRGAQQRGLAALKFGPNQ